MIYDTQALSIKYRDYKNIPQKVVLETKKKHLVRIKRGLYSDNLRIDKPVIANVCYGPSYISFEYALSYYGLIPEYVSAVTSSCFQNKNNKRYSISGMTFEYQRIPDKAFSSGITFLQNEEGIHYKIACKEKALCDQLYSMYPVRSITLLKQLLFEDLRIDEEEFMKLDFDYIMSIIPLYHSSTLYTLSKYLKEVKDDKND